MAAPTWHCCVCCRVLSLAADAARALLYLHHVAKPAVVHRDVKPANFLLDRAWRMKLADFGLAANSSKQVRTVQGSCGKMLQRQFRNSVEGVAAVFLLCRLWAGGQQQHEGAAFLEPTCNR